MAFVTKNGHLLFYNGGYIYQTIRRCVILIASYPSLTAAANALNHNRKAISANLANRTKTSGGFVWKYVT
jgi:hypothetical protein